MAFAHAPALFVATALLLAFPATAQDPACAPVTVTDLANDVVVWPAVPAPDEVRRPELDVLATSIALDGDDVVLTATLGAVPTTDGPYSYRYWFGFHVRPAGAEAEYMDIRMHGKADLLGAPLITSNEQGLETIASLVPAWNGTTATFRFPLALIHDVYGTTDLEVGQPAASTDGPFNQETLMWFPTGIAYQVDHAPDGVGGWEAAEPCPEPVTTVEAQPEGAQPGAAPAPVPPFATQTGAQPGPAQDAPGLGALALAVTLLGVAFLARRRMP